jgi:hypothetical protein
VAGRQEVESEPEDDEEQDQEGPAPPSTDQTERYAIGEVVIDIARS